MANLDTLAIIASYEEANALLFKARMDCIKANNLIGHAIVCKAQRRLEASVKEQLEIGAAQ